MAARDPLICPFEYSNKPQRHIEPTTSKKIYMHVDGDMLHRLVALGGVSILRSMLYQEPHPDHRFVDFDSAATRYERFIELVHDAIGDGGYSDPVHGAVDFMRTILEPQV